MSKKELGLLGYLGYKSVKNEPSKLGKEIGECIIGIIFAMIFNGCVLCYYDSISSGAFTYYE